MDAYCHQSMRPDASTADARGDATPDAALLVAFANGDSASGQELVSRLAPPLFAHAFRTLGSEAEAEDVVQETLFRLWKIAPEWRQGEAKVLTWAWRVATNLCTDRLRKRGRSVDLDSIAEPESDLQSAVDAMTDTARIEALDAALATLPERQAQAVRLRHLDGLSNPEIAEILDLSVEAVESLTARGKRALAALLKGRRAELGYEDD